MKIHSGTALRALFALSLLARVFSVRSQDSSVPVYPVLRDKWQLENNNSIFFDAGHSPVIDDNIEMSGSRASLWVKYAVDTAKKLTLEHTAVFPNFRLKPNDTHASLMYTFGDEDLPRFFAGGKPVQAMLINGNFYRSMKETTSGIRQNGIMQVFSRIDEDKTSLELERDLFPSADKPAVLQSFTFTNKGKSPIMVTMEALQKTIRTDPARSEPVPHYVTVKSLNPGAKMLQPGDTAQFGIACYASNDDSSQLFDLAAEKKARQQRLEFFNESLRLETPDTIINAAFAFAKRRISESIFETKTGPMMCPGGLRYYAAIWANDEAEYANPFYAFTADELGILAAVNSYGMFAKYMNAEFRPLPSSIVAEGDSIWAGAGDRGDAAMIAQGASRFALVYGNADTARKLWPLISWCLEYCRHKKNAKGVLSSDSDELEGRFPSGKANLEANSLYYDALKSAARLAAALHLPASTSKGYELESKKIAAAIESYFGADIHGFHSYKYYAENTQLRSWICMPLAMGITERKKGTVDALFSPFMFSPDGILTQEGSTTFWDRSTLYSLRGIFAAGETAKGISFLHYFSQRRLLGDHVPYPVEAYPEGNQRHLAGESALYCRIFTEGLFGIRATGFHSFALTPRLPAAWKQMAIKEMNAFGNRLDILVNRDGGGKLSVTINRKDAEPLHYSTREDETILVNLD